MFLSDFNNFTVPLIWSTDLLYFHQCSCETWHVQYRSNLTHAPALTRCFPCSDFRPSELHKSCLYLITRRRGPTSTKIKHLLFYMEEMLFLQKQPPQVFCKKKFSRKFKKKKRIKKLKICIIFGFRLNEIKCLWVCVRQCLDFVCFFYLTGNTLSTADHCCSMTKLFWKMS